LIDGLIGCSAVGIILLSVCLSVSAQPLFCSNTKETHFFLPRDASVERGDATVSRLSVCPSVCNDQVP